MKDFLRFIKEYIRPYWFRMILAIVVTCIMSLYPFILGYLGKVMVDDVLQVGKVEKVKKTLPKDSWEIRKGSPPKRISPPIQPEFRKKSQSEKLYWLKLLVLAYIGLRLFFAGLSWLYRYTMVFVGQRIVYHMRRQLHAKLQSLQMTFFDRQQTGKLMARVLDDVESVQDSVTGLFVGLFHNSARLIVGALILLQIDWSLGLIALGTLPFYALSYHFFKRRVRENSRLLRAKNAEVYGVATERINGIRVVQSFIQERFEVRQFFHKIAEFLRLRLRHSLLNVSTRSIGTLISGIGTALILYFGALEVKSGSLSLGLLLYFYSSVSFIFMPVVELTDMNVRLQWVLVIIGRIFEVLDESITIRDSEDALRLDRIRGDVRFVRVSLKYEGATNYALRDINFHIPPGTSVSIVGPSGSGKSSLINLLLRLYDPTEGAIYLDGYDIKDIKLSSLRDHIGVVLQEPILFSGTISENISYGRSDAKPRQIMDAAKIAEIHDFIYGLPEKYETGVGERGENLSGGQKQRLAFAMAILTDPNILVLDDSTSALDAQTEARIQQTLERIMAGRTSFVITHRASTAMRTDLILVLNQGRLVEMGSHEELILTGGIYSRMFEQQQLEHRGESVGAVG